MADYNTLDEAINAGINNMTLWRSGKNDDETYTYSTSMTWFKVQGESCSTVKINGNSCMGFTSGTEWIKVNRRDAACYNEYWESGTISGVRFFKIRWYGYSVYNKTSSRYMMTWSIFFIDNGDHNIFITYTPPDYNNDGYFVCGETDIGVLKNSPWEVTLKPTDPVQGTGWTVVSGRPVFKATSGSAVYHTTVTSQDKEQISWDSTIPTDTTLNVYAKYGDNPNYSLIQNGYIFDKFIKGQTYSLDIKIEMTATVSALDSPKLYNLRLTNANNRKVIVIDLSSPVTTPLTDPIDVSYDGLGGLQGYGGSVPAYTGQIPVS